MPRPVLRYHVEPAGGGRAVGQRQVARARDARDVLALVAVVAQLELERSPAGCGRGGRPACRSRSPAVALVALEPVAGVAFVTSARLGPSPGGGR
jgi:hypothetical protein